MASVIKNQLIKHLSKFTKNLSPDKIQLSTLKGEGELKNLELNEAVLMELLELPTWLRLRRAICNKVTIRIQFSKLKSQPIRLYLDEVRVDMETCEQLRQPASASGMPSYSSGGKYSFGDRVVDGMYLQVNTVIVKFTSKAFRAELQISRIVMQSKTPTWREAADLRQTRISEKHRDLLLTFKEVEWQTVTLEANCMVRDGEKMVSAVNTPLRFIANQAKIRISVKKRYSDCSVVASRVQLIMDDLLWILTDSQMKAAFVFVKHIKSNIDKAAEQTKQMADKLLQKERQSQSRPSLASPHTALFNKFDIQESSFHVQSSRIDFHICDDINSADPNRNRQVDGGAMGIALMKLSLDHYPVRGAGASRQHWPAYDECMSKRDNWAQSLLDAYGSLLQRLRSRAATGPTQRPAAEAGAALSSLIERSLTLRVEDFFITTVSLAKLDERRPKKLLASDKKALLLPKEMSSIHAEYTEYFFPHDNGIPVLSSNIYVQINPIVLAVDVTTILWLNSFALSLLRDVESVVKELSANMETKTSEATILRLEMLMPKVVLPALILDACAGVSEMAVAARLHPAEPSASSGSLANGSGRPPSALQLQVSLLTITNAFADPSNGEIASNERDNPLPRADEASELVASYRALHLAASSGFPSESTDTTLLEADTWARRAIELQQVSTRPQRSSCAAAVWRMSFDQVWMEFISGAIGATSRPASFVESFPLTAWIALPPPVLSVKDAHIAQIADVSGGRRMDVLVKLGAKVCAQLNAPQYCFLMKVTDDAVMLMDNLKKEVVAHLGASASPAGDGSDLVDKPVVAVLLHIVEIEFALVTPLFTSVPNAVAAFKSSLSTGARSESWRGSSTLNDGSRSEGKFKDARSSHLNSPAEEFAAFQSASPPSSGYSFEDGTIVSCDARSSLQTPPSLPQGPDVREGSHDGDSGTFIPQDAFVTLADVHAKVAAWHQPPDAYGPPTLLPETSVVMRKDSRSMSVTSSSSTVMSAGIAFGRESATVKLTSAFAKITSRVKNVAKGAGGFDEDDSMSDWDTVSMRSDDDGDFTLVNLGDEMPAFTSTDRSGFLDEISSVDTDSVSTDRSKRMVAVTIFKVCGIECGIEMKGDNLIAKMAVGHLTTTDMENILYDDFQSRHMAAQSVLEEIPREGLRPSAPPVLVRFVSGPQACYPLLDVTEQGFAKVVVTDYSFSFLTSTMDKLSSFFATADTSSSSGASIPVVVEVRNVDITLKSDDGVAGRQAKPRVMVHISKVVVVRSADGAVSIQGDTIAETFSPLPKPRRFILRDIAVNTDYASAERSDVAVPAAHNGGKACGLGEGDESATQLILREMGFLRKENEEMRAQIVSLQEQLRFKEQCELEGPLQKIPGEEKASFSASSSNGINRATGALQQQQYTGEIVRLERLLQTQEEAAALLRQCLREATDEAEEARAERECLLKTVRLLQTELTASELGRVAAAADISAADGKQS